MFVIANRRHLPFYSKTFGRSFSSLIKNNPTQSLSQYKTSSQVIRIGPDSLLRNKNGNKINSGTSLQLLTNVQQRQENDLKITHWATQIGTDKYLLNVQLFKEINYIKPRTLNFVIDVSGSMNETTGTDSETRKFSQIDLVKHSIRTLTHCLSDHHLASCITFNESANVLEHPIEMNDINKRKLLISLDLISAKGGTNLWSGIDAVNKLITNMSTNTSINTSTIVLTDGQSNCGVRDVLQEFINFHDAKRRSSYHFFGYGNDIDHSLLNSLALHGGGLFTHISDHTMCNTAFINFLSNLLTTVYERVNVKLNENTLNNIAIDNNTLADPYMPYNGTSPLLSGTPKNYSFVIDTSKPTNVNLSFDVSYDGHKTSYNVSNLNVQKMLTSLPMLRATFMQVVHEGIKNPQSAQVLVDNLWNTLQHQKASNPTFDAFCESLKSIDRHKGQVEKAFKPEYFSSWGVPYLLSLMSAHRHEQCTNFKDPSVQLYTNNMFLQLRSEIEEIFNNIPMPTASLAPPSQPFAANFQQTFYNSSNPCIGENNLCLMHDGSQKLIKDLRKGDMIHSGAKICCVIKTPLTSAKLQSGIQMIYYEGLLITAYHPIRVNNQWEFPIDVENAHSVLSRELKCTAVYNFILDGKHEHVMRVNDVDVITLGHGVMDDDVLAHPFFGTTKVIDELKRQPGWDNGFIEIADYKPTYKNGIIDSFGSSSFTIGSQIFS